MKLFKAKASLFSGSYYKELFKELKVIGIVCALFQLLYGIMGEFGTGTSASPLVILTGFGMNRSHPDIFTLFFFASALSFMFSHVHRKNWDFRNSLPIAKRTMFACHFAAVMTWTAIIFAANFLGVLIGEGLRLVMSTTAVADGFGMSALSMLRSVIDGVTLYCLCIIIASIVNRVIPVLAAFGVVIFLPILFVGFEAYIRFYGMDTLELFFPLGINGLAAFKTIASILFALLTIVLAYIAFGKSRVETFQKPARTAAINVIIGLGIAACVGIAAIAIFENSEFMFYRISGALYKSGAFYLCIAYAFIPMLIAYFIYMWITHRSFVAALKKLVFLPLVLFVFGAAILIAMIADNKWEKLDFSVDNIDYVRIKDEHFGLNTSTDYYDYMFYGAGTSSRGSSKAFSVKHTDSTIRLLASKLAANVKDYADDGLTALMERYVDANANAKIEVTLKDGTKWCIRDRNYAGPAIGTISLEDLEDNKEYVDALGSLDRFNGGRVIDPLDLGKEFNKTLLDELSSLSSFERARIFIESANSGSMYYYGYQEYYYAGETQYGSDEWSSDYGYALTLVSPTYDHVARLSLGEHLPKTTELFMKLMDERTRAHKDYGELVSGLKSSDFVTFNASLKLFKDGKMLQSWLDLDGKTSAESGLAATDKEYARLVGEICALLAECIEAKEPIENAASVLGVEINGFIKDLGEGYYYYSNRAFEGITPKLFVGISAEKAEQLTKLVGEFNRNYSSYYYDEFPYQYEFGCVMEAVVDGRLKLYFDDGTEISDMEFEKMYYSGTEWFYVEGGEQLHITELFERIMTVEDDTL